MRHSIHDVMNIEHFGGRMNAVAVYECLHMFINHFKNAAMQIYEYIYNE